MTATAGGAPVRRVARPPVVRVGALSVRLAPRGLAAGVGLVAVAAVVAVLAIGTGDFPVSPPDVIAALTGGGTPAHRFIVGEIRAPRVLTGLLVGAAFGVSGALFQSVTRNPLGSPDFLGFTAGASTGGILAVILGGTGWVIAGGSLLGCAAASLAVYLLSYRRGAHGYRLVLVGAGVAAILLAVDSYLLTRADIHDAASAAAWLTGSLSGRGWDHAVPVALALAVLVPLCAPLSRPLRMIEMGDDAAQAMGIAVERVRLAAVLIGVALCGVATAAAGPVAFVALAAPQLARRLTGSPGVTLIASGLMGAVLLILSDLAAQRVIAPAQLPVGIMTAALGGAYLAWLLRKERR
ncbi:iron complex transport system permease protein [Thermocatellispora tengchongensis]|uniref:Iron complex transport system permease protein n=1 Tax=Thermocatellispora tengchongensis TaxID=1073253 RepID=A0A840P2X2_9ACTN|nr:iron chelate uptake ABC transporter family permease subunit [Thermocatellispora tengchongensis]MBB5132846.1 iron complex transport system permease protein [Thermocatellispora tengchongensis]